jgi:glycosyltransferase involved in cell wall biosynthesis
VEFAARRFGLDPGRSFVVHHGLPRDLLGLPLPDATEGEGIRIAQIGTYIHRKGITFGAIALNRVLDALPGVSVTFLGTGVSAEAVHADFSERVRDRVNVVESFDRHKLPQLLEGHQIILMPALAEGFAKALLEGMACGLAPVATAIAGPTEFVVNGKTGLLVPPADADALERALVAVVGDRTLRARLRRAAHATAQAFTWDRNARQRSDLYERLLAERSSPAHANVSVGAK